MIFFVPFLLTIGLEPITQWVQILSLLCLPISPSECFLFYRKKKVLSLIRHPSYKEKRENPSRVVFQKPRLSKKTTFFKGYKDREKISIKETGNIERKQVILKENR